MQYLPNERLQLGVRRSADSHFGGDRYVTVARERFANNILGQAKPVRWRDVEMCDAEHPGLLDQSDTCLG
jgi:hypothetical protein